MWTSLALGAMVIAYPAPRDTQTADKGPGYIGITFEATEDGVLVNEVRPDGPALAAGLRTGDVIRKFNGEAIDFQHFAPKIVRLRAGTVVFLDVQRGEERVAIRLKLGVRPDDFPLPPPNLDDPQQIPDLPNLPPPQVPEP